jgi:Methyltransferase domain
LGLPFDHYQRYKLTQQLVSVLWDSRDHPISVLDVGGSSSSLKHFLPADELVLLDLQPPPEFTYREDVPFAYDDYLIAAGGHLPFGDSAFDLVTAHDTLEHVPPEMRGEFILDLLRVSRRFVILDGPIYRDETAQAETLLAEFVRNALGGNNRSLDEHIQLGLPDRSVIEGILNENGYHFEAIPNGNLYRWMLMMALKHYILAFPDNDRPHAVLDRTYNELLSADDFGPLCYREAFVVAKHAAEASVLDRIKQVVPQPAVTPPNQAVAAFESLLNALEEHSGRVLAMLSDRQARISELASVLQTQRAEISSKDEALAWARDQITERERDVSDLEARLAAIQSSMGYRMLSNYRRRIGMLFPAGSRRGVPYRGAKSLAKNLLAKDLDARGDGGRSKKH